MVEVRLHGALAQEFGKVWHLDIRSPAEAVSALMRLRPAFRMAIKRLHDAGTVFRVRTKDHDFGNDDLGLTLGSNRRLDIIPLVSGASAGVRAVIGVVLMVAAYTIDPSGTTSTYLAKAMFATGFAMTTFAVVEMLTPVKRSDSEKKNLESWSVSGPTNTADQGSPVPVIYGEVLTGGVTISAGISVDQVMAGDTVSATIRGSTEISVYTSVDGISTAVVELSASVSRSGDISTAYAWTYSGFPLAVAHRWVRQTGGKMRLELDYDVSSGAYIIDTGSLSVEVTMVDLDIEDAGYTGRYGEPATRTYTVSASKPVSTFVGNSPLA